MVKARGLTLLLASAALAASCIVERVSPEGRECDATHPCGAGFRCEPAGCESDGGEPNLLANGGFDDGTTGWRAGNPLTGLEAQQVTRINGATARVFAKGANAGARLEVSADLPATSAEAWVCAQAKLQKGTFDRRIHLFLSRRTADGGMDISVDELFEPGSFLEPSAPANQPLAVAKALPPDGGAGTAVLTLLAAPPVATGDIFFVDDVRAWAPAGGTCRRL